MGFDAPLWGGDCLTLESPAPMTCFVPCVSFLQGLCGTLRGWQNPEAVSV